jgi:hypothetical protein
MYLGRDTIVFVKLTNVEVCTSLSVGSFAAY